MKKRWRLYLIYSLTILGFLTTAHYGSRAVTTLVESTPVQRKHCILIDPGHGGIDGGASSCSGQPESSYNLEISLRLKDLLLFLGSEVQMTRQTDISIHTAGETIAQRKASDLKERVRIANSLNNPLLLSIHQNHFPDSRYSGAQVFYAKTPGSEALAKELQASFCKVLNPGSNRKSKLCKGIYLMEHIQCPGILIECGFLSNQAEDAKLRSPDYQKKLSAVIAATVSQFLSNT